MCNVCICIAYHFVYDQKTIIIIKAIVWSIEDCNGRLQIQMMYVLK